MELVFALIARCGGYKQSDSFVPEPAEFLPFNLRALERSYGSETASHSEIKIRNELIFSKQSRIRYRRFERHWSRDSNGVRA